LRNPLGATSGSRRRSPPALCLVCHGEQIDPAVEAALAGRYPHHVAWGYRAGMVRGAFSVKMKAD